MIVGALSIVLGLVTGLGLLYFWQDGMIFLRPPPPYSAPRAPGLVIQEVNLVTTDPLSLRGWLARPARAAGRKLPIVLYFGGNAEEVSEMATLAGQFPGWSLLAANYRGYGGNPGQPSEPALIGDALAWHDWAAAREDVDARRIAVLGRSLGSGVAVHVAAQRSLAGVVLVTPFDSLRAVAQRHYPYLPVAWLLKHPFDSLARAPRIDTPLLILSAEHDHIVPAQHARRLFEAWRGPKDLREIAGTGHNDLDTHPDYWKTLAAFFAKVPPARDSAVPAITIR